MMSAHTLEVRFDNTTLSPVMSIIASRFSLSYSNTRLRVGSQSAVFSRFPVLEDMPPRLKQNRISEAYQTMLASEKVLKRDWESPEEDAAWANL